jgi:hypothetical protein
MRRLLAAALAAGFWLAASAAAHAGFQFTFSNVSDIPSQGQHTINVFLHWDHTGTNTLSPAGGGLSEADFGIRLLQSSPGTVSVANPTGSDVTFNSDFDFHQKNTPSTSGFTTVSGYSNLAALQLGIITNGPVTTAGAGNGLGSADTLYLGSFNLTAGTNNGVTPLAVTIRAFVRNTQAPNQDNFMDASFTPMDTQIVAGDATFNVTGLPEPGTLVLTGISLAGAAAVRWRKRWKTADIVVAS